MRVVYGRVGVRAEMPKFWLDFRDDLKRVQDDIADDVYRVVPVLVLGANPTLTETTINQNYNLPIRPPPADILPMRNSLVNTAYLDSRWMPWDGLQVVNTFKYVFNYKFEDKDKVGNLLQDKQTLHNFSMVNKASYTREIWPKVEITGRVKHLLATWDEGSYVPVDTLGTIAFFETHQEVDGTTKTDTVTYPESQASWSLFTPELILSYALTPRTRIEYGQHGLFLPFLRSRFIDRDVKTNSFTQGVSLIQFTMLGDYGGYKMMSSFGLRWENVDYHRRSFNEDIDFTAFFVDVIFSPE